MQVITSQLPTPFGNFTLHAFAGAADGKEHIALTMGDVADGDAVLTRLHSECLTGDTLFSQRCDCGPQLHEALKRIGEAKKGVLLYLRQEGRGIGLFNKIKAYQLQDLGADTVEANHQLGFDADERNYDVATAMLAYLKVKHIRLMTNNPKKVKAMEQMGIQVVSREPIQVGANDHNHQYLATKASKLNHLLD